jgi:hypothetical protein
VPSRGNPGPRRALCAEVSWTVKWWITRGPDRPPVCSPVAASVIMAYRHCSRPRAGARRVPLPAGAPLVFAGARERDACRRFRLGGDEGRLIAESAPVTLASAVTSRPGAVGPCCVRGVRRAGGASNAMGLGPVLATRKARPYRSSTRQADNAAATNRPRCNHVAILQHGLGHGATNSVSDVETGRRHPPSTTADVAVQMGDHRFPLVVGTVRRSRGAGRQTWPTCASQWTRDGRRRGAGGGPA